MKLARAFAIATLLLPLTAQADPQRGISTRGDYTAGIRAGAGYGSNDASRGGPGDYGIPRGMRMFGGWFDFSQHPYKAGPPSAIGQQRSRCSGCGQNGGRGLGNGRNS